jgi:hypothetical protein
MSCSSALDFESTSDATWPSKYLFNRIIYFSSSDRLSMPPPTTNLKLIARQAKSLDSLRGLHAKNRPIVDRNHAS